jgi:hypothetical protein
VTQLPIPLHVTERPDPDDIAGPATEPAAPATGSRPLVRLSGGQMCLREQSAAALVHAFRMAFARLREMARREGGLPHALRAGKPPSFDEECDYARSRAWVPPGHDGGLFEWLGVIHHALIGRPGVALGNSISAICHKPLRFWLLVLTVLVIVFLIWKG